VPAGKHIRVWDSTAEIRYLVIPERPAGTDAMSEEELAELVTRDSMIGTGLPRSPGRDERRTAAPKALGPAGRARARRRSHVRRRGSRRRA